MEYMFQAGFLGTRAPFFMDFVTIIVALLPLLIFIAILFAKKGQIKLHIASQIFLFLFALVVVGYFEYGVRAGGGFEDFAKGSSLSGKFLFGFLLLHIAISLITVIIWSKTIFGAIKGYKAGALPGNSSAGHRKIALMATAGICLTSLTGLMVYLFLFLF